MPFVRLTLPQCSHAGGSCLLLSKKWVQNKSWKEQLQKIYVKMYKIGNKKTSSIVKQILICEVACGASLCAAGVNRKE